VEAEGVQRPARGLDLALLTPVDLRLGASQDLKAPVQVGRIGRDADQPFPVLAHIHLDPLVVPVEPVLGDQPLVDRDRLELRLLCKPGVDEVGVRVDLARAGPTPGRRRRARARIGRQIALDRSPVVPGLPGDLGPRGPGLGQGPKGTQFHPCLLREDHGPPSFGPAGSSLPAEGWRPHDNG
jgi:hypothetical protein